MEAHGGYAFCGLSALVILQKGHLVDQQALLVRFFYCTRIMYIVEIKDLNNNFGILQIFFINFISFS